MNIFVSAPLGNLSDTYFPENVMRKLRSLGNVTRNPESRDLSGDEIAEYMRTVDIVITHWGSPKFTKAVLDRTPNLKLIAHAAGSVANIASDAVYERGIPVISANPVMAKYVAEFALGMMISSSRKLTQFDSLVRKNSFDKHFFTVSSLIGAEVGLVGLGTVGRYLLDLLRPFGCRVFVYDPYLPENALDAWENASLTDLKRAMSCPFVSVHAPKNAETAGLINADNLKYIPDGGFLINTARAAVVDTAALIKEVESGRIYAAIDVFDEEKDRAVPEGLISAAHNTLLSPHAAALPATWIMTDAIADDIARFIAGEKLRLEVPYAQFSRMTV